jgi:glycosyltransferase involved in cell wall biosynthesis
MSALSFPVKPTVLISPESDSLEISVIMPCLNESATIGTCVRKALQAIDELGLRGEVVIGDNGSTDGSQTIAANLGARVVLVEARGYGAALLGAISAARGRFVVMGDSDNSYDFSQIGLFVSKLREGFDLVIGNRFTGGILPGAMPFLHRYLGNPILTSIGKLFYRSPVGDFHCGFRAFRKGTIQQLQLQALGMEFASEMVVKATLYGLRLTEVPTKLSPTVVGRTSHLRTWRDGWRHLRFLLLYSPRWLFLYPGVFLCTVGILAGLCLLRAPLTIGKVTFDVDTLLFSAMLVLIGFQSVNFAAFTEEFAVMEGFRPDDPHMTRLFRLVTLKTGLLFGAALFLTGIGMWIAGLHYWSTMHFGSLNPAKALRIAIPGIVCSTLGVQVVLSSFFRSVLDMKRRIHRNTSQEQAPEPIRCPAEAVDRPRRSQASRNAST